MTPNPRREKQGLLFTLDGVIALVTALVLITGILFLVHQTSDVASRQGLDAVTRDIATTLEKDGTYRVAVDISSTTIMSRYLNALPSHLCARISLFDQNQNQVLTTTKSACTSVKPKSVTHRAFITTGLNTYYAQVEGWYAQ